MTLVAGLRFFVSESDGHCNLEMGIRSRSKFINCNY